MSRFAALVLVHAWKRSIRAQRIGRQFRACVGRAGASMDTACLLLLVLVGFLTYSRELLLGWMPMDMDILTEGIPFMAWLGRMIQSGQDPLWVSGVLGGFPLGFGEYPLFDPISWLAASILDGNRATAVVRLVYVTMGGVAAYGYSRTIGLSALVSLAAAVGYQLNTEAVGMPASGNGVQALFLLPTLLLCIEMVFDKGVSWASLAAACVAVSLSAGGAYVTAIALLNAGVYALARTVVSWGHGHRRKAMLSILALGAAVVLGLGVAGFRVLPTLVIAGDSVRGRGMSLAAAATGSPGLLGLLAGYLLPLSRMPELGNRGEYYAPGYIGPFLLLLAALAITRVRKSRLAAIFAGLALFNIMASMGDAGPLFGLLHSLPGMGFFRGPQRFSTASAFFLGLLAAVAMEQGVASQSKLGQSWPRMLAAFATAVVAFAFVAGVLWLYGGGLGSGVRGFADHYKLGAANPLRVRMALALLAIPAALWLLHLHRSGRVGRSLFSWLCVSLTVLLLLAVDAGVTTRQPEPSGVPATARFLQKDGSLFRVMSGVNSITINLYLSFLTGADPTRVDGEGPQAYDFRYRFMRETLAKNFSLEYGLESVDGQALLQSRRQAIALCYLGSGGELDYFEQVDPKLAAKLWSMQNRNIMDHLPVLRAFNVKYVLTNLELWQHSESLRLAFTSPIPMFDPRAITNVYAYEVVGALPRAYLVPVASEVGGADEALDALASEKVDPLDVVLLEEAPPSLRVPTLDVTRSRVDVVSYKSTEVVLEAQTDGSGFLVLNDAFHPGWSAWVDGQESPVLVANGWVRAVVIPSAGRHTVRFAYSPPMFLEGIRVALASLALVVLAPSLQRVWRHARTTLRDACTG